MERIDGRGNKINYANIIIIILHIPLSIFYILVYIITPKRIIYAYLIIRMLCIVDISNLNYTSLYDITAYSISEWHLTCDIKGRSVSFH